MEKSDKKLSCYFRGKKPIKLRTANGNQRTNYRLINYIG